MGRERYSVSSLRASRVRWGRWAVLGFVGVEGGDRGVDRRYCSGMKTSKVSFDSRLDVSLSEGTGVVSSNENGSVRQERGFGGSRERKHTFKVYSGYAKYTILYNRSSNPPSSPLISPLWKSHPLPASPPAPSYTRSASPSSASSPNRQAYSSLGLRHPDCPLPAAFRFL